MIPMYEAIKALLVERGWAIDAGARENQCGELHEFIHPETGRRMAYIDAILAEEERELSRRPSGVSP